MLGLSHAEEQAVEWITVSLRQVRCGQYVFVAQRQDDGPGRSHLVAEALRRDWQLAEPVFAGVNAASTAAANFFSFPQPRRRPFLATETNLTIGSPLLAITTSSPLSASFTRRESWLFASSMLTFIAASRPV